MPLTKFFKNKYGFEIGMFPATDDVFQRAVSLPIHHCLQEKDIEFVVSVFLDKAGL